MCRVLENTLFRRILAILTGIAVMVCFSLAAAEPLRAAGLAAEWQGGLSRGVYYFFPGKTGDPALFAKSDDTRVSHLRIDYQRIVTPWGVNGLLDTFYLSQSKTSLKSGAVNKIEANILKLRI